MRRLTPLFFVLALLGCDDGQTAEEQCHGAAEKLCRLACECTSRTADDGHCVSNHPEYVDHNAVAGSGSGGFSYDSEEECLSFWAHIDCDRDDIDWSACSDAAANAVCTKDYFADKFPKDNATHDSLLFPEECGPSY